MSNQNTNAEFLNAIFGNRASDTRVVYCRFPGDPHQRKSWPHSVWAYGDIEGGQNTYFGVAAVKPDKEGRLGRRKDNFAGLHCVMLDDVGTKANDDLPLTPSWLIETSPGNHQAGFIFEQPIELAEAEALLKALTVANRLTDPGGQNVVRWARLPVGINSKGTLAEPFTCELRAWNPESRYRLDELVSALGLDLLAHTATRRSRKSGVQTDPGDTVYTPRAESNPVITALQARNLYKKPLGSGKHELTCPWVAEHTDQADSGTVYFEPDDNFVRGGFKCQHGHCASRHINELLSLLGVTDHEAKHKPTFRISGGTLHIAVNNAERVMAETGRYFQQGGAIVSVMTPPGGETAARHIRKEALPFLLTGHASWLRNDARSGEWVPIDAPNKVCSGLFDAPEYLHLPALNAIARQPYLRPDGSVVTQAGFDPVTGTFGAFDARLFNVIENPSESEIQSALRQIMALVIETSFATEADKAAALAAFLTAAARPSLPVAPGFLFNAHQPGSGKSYLQDLAILFATDGDVASATLKANDDEMEKSILATLLRSPAVVRFDEAQGDILPIKFLVSSLTSEHVAGRILGQSKVIAPSTRSLFLFAGNNIQPVGDMLRRVLVCNLDAKVENPESREFKHDPLTYLRDHRAEYVSAALTLICAHHQAKERMPCRPLNGFPRWDEWIRQTVMWLGLTDPCTSMFAVARTDPNHERLSELLEVWGECFGSEPKAARDAIKRADETSQRLKAILLEIAGKNGEIDATKLGYWLKRNEGKVISGKRFERDESKSPFAKYAARILPNFQTDEQTPKTPTTPSNEIEQSTRGYRTTRGSTPDREKVSVISSWGEIE
ncbi:MAG: RepB family DNA primase [Methylococcaceae bacterium]|nr:RepB family DNA primase [Methylococcaceae bacterium]